MDDMAEIDFFNFMKIKKNTIFKNFGNSVEGFIVTFKQLNASLRNKYINFFQINKQV